MVFKIVCSRWVQHRQTFFLNISFWLFRTRSKSQTFNSKMTVNICENLTQIRLAKTSGLMALLLLILKAFLFVWIHHKACLVSWMDDKNTVLTILGHLRSKNNFFAPFCNKKWKIGHGWSYFNPFNWKIQTKVRWFLKPSVHFSWTFCLDCFVVSQSHRVSTLKRQSIFWKFDSN